MMPPAKPPPLAKRPPPKRWPPAPPGKAFIQGLLCYKQNTNFPIQTCDTVECPYGPYGEQGGCLLCGQTACVHPAPRRRVRLGLDEHASDSSGAPLPPQPSSTPRSQSAARPPLRGARRCPSGATA
jgi:hypothetical protein